MNLNFNLNIYYADWFLLSHSITIYFCSIFRQKNHVYLPSKKKILVVPKNIERKIHTWKISIIKANLTTRTNWKLFSKIHTYQIEKSNNYLQTKVYIFCIQNSVGFHLSVWQEILAVKLWKIAKAMTTHLPVFSNILGSGKCG